MSVIVIGIGLLVVLMIAFKVMRLVMSGCMKLVVLAVLVGACAAAYYYLRGHIVLP